MYFQNLDELSEREIVAGYRARFIHTEKLTLAYWTVEAGAALPEHSHPHEQIANVLVGEFELTVAGESRILVPGQIAVIPGDVTHGGRAITDCKLLDVFHPARDDYR
jgi:quercetin dioxygenase-like cupin family protein